MRVLLISHTCQSTTEGQPRATHLARLPDLELMVLVPNRWLHYQQWRRATVPAEPNFRLRVGKVAWPWTGPGQFYLHWYPELPLLLRSFRPDIIDLWEEPWALVSAEACFLRNHLLPTAAILSETEQNINKRLPLPFEMFRRYTLRNSQYVVARNNEAVQVTRSKGYAGPAEVIPNAVDTGLFRPLDRQECRKQLGLSGFTAGYVGRLVEEKGLLDMVNALPLCPPSVQLLFVGAGAFQHVLEQRCRELSVESRVQFLPARPLAELAEVMNALDVLVLPSHTTARWKEQFGRVIIEAQACGTPVIGSNSGAIPDVIGDGGLVFPEQDTGALAAAIRTMESDPAGRARMGEAGMRQANNHYTWARIAERYASIYARLRPTT